MYSEADHIITKNFEIRMDKHSLQIGNEKRTAVDKTFNVKIRKRFSDLILEHCDDSILVDSKKPASQMNAITNISAKSLNSLINTSWKNCKKNFTSSNQKIKVGDIVLAKMATYCPWPSRIESLASNGKRAQVYFFGEHNRGSVNVSEIVLLSECHDVIRLLVLRKLGTFHKSISEIETMLKIPSHQSFLKEIPQIKTYLNK